MKKDKEFKAKNREESYIKDNSPDMKLGRHSKFSEKPHVTQSKKNRMYQQRQEPTNAPENITVNADTPYAEDMQIDLAKEENTNSEQQTEFIEFSETKPLDINSNSPHTEKPKPKSSHRRRIYQKHTPFSQKPVDFDITENSQNSDVPQSKKEQFSKETDYSFTDNSSESAQSAHIPFDKVQSSFDEKKADTQKSSKKNRLYQSKQDKNTVSDKKPDTVKSETPEKSEQPEKDIPFDRVAWFEKKAQKAKSKAEKAKQNLPHKKKIKRQRTFDEEKKKTKTRLQFEKEAKPQSDMYHRSPIKGAATFSGHEVLNKAHAKISEVEGENSAVEAAHKTEKKAETLVQYSMRTGRYISSQRRSAPYKKAARLKHKAEKLEVKAIYEKTLAENPQLKKNVVKKFVQKRCIKKQYQKAKQAEQAAKTAKKTVQNTEKAAARLAAFIWRHKAVIGTILAIILMICWLASAISSCSVMLTTGFNSIMVSSYFAEDEDIYAAENYYISLEQALQRKLNNIESTYPNYDKYNYNLSGVGHNPYELISYLTAVYEDFKFNDVKSGLDELFNRQYHLRVTQTTEQRTDENGNTYEYKTLNVTLLNNGIANALTEEQRELYYIYLGSKGNRDYLFANDIYANESPQGGYMIPGEALTDETFRKLITEAEKYLGYPYVWGGSSPSTSFDCSGFVCYVFKNSGVYPLGRTTAQGIYNQCARISPSEAKPGDIIFFTGTYNAGEPVTHVGIVRPDRAQVEVEERRTDKRYYTVR